MNKTQKELISRIVNRSVNSSGRGWAFTNAIQPFLHLFTLNEGNQALKLAEAYPKVFSANYCGWRLVSLKLLDETKARELIK